MEKELEEKLFVSNTEKYGDKYIEHLLDQYKMYVDSVEKISDRRQKTNEFFLAINTALVTILGFLSSKLETINNGIVLFICAISGGIMCYLWYRIIYSYKGLNEGKFKLIHKIESRLPLSIYDTEWKILGEGKNKEIYWPFSHIELLVPKIFIVIYLFITITIIPWFKIFSFVFC